MFYNRCELQTENMTIHEKPFALCIEVCYGRCKRNLHLLWWLPPSVSTSNSGSDEPKVLRIDCRQTILFTVGALPAAKSKLQDI